MNLANCASLKGQTESGLWVRAIALPYWDPKDPLYTKHTSSHATRFNPGSKAKTPFEILYLAENSLVASLEIGTLQGNPYAPGGLTAQLRHSYVSISVAVNLHNIADLAAVNQQERLETTAQELTGDWRGYIWRNLLTSVTGPTGIAPTQELGETLFSMRLNAPNLYPCWEGFRTVSARAPDSLALVVFPQNLLAGSYLEFTDPVTRQSHRVEGMR